jgi:hypothetical protein
MAKKKSSQYQATMIKRRGDVELSFDLDGDRRAAIMKCLDGGDLRMVLQDVDVDKLAGGNLGGGYLWD